MSTANNYPSFNEFWKNEFKTLEYLKARTLLKTFSDLTSSIEAAYHINLGPNKSKKVSDFNFHCAFTMKIEGHEHEVIIGANVLIDFRECSYFLAIAGKDHDNDKLIRKFHFDYAIPQNSTRQKVPVFHLQYGGQLSPQTHAHGLKGDKLDTWLSLPRLNFSPINLALLLDTMFCEFRTEETHKIVEDPEWRTLIYENEKILTKIYFTNIVDHLKSPNHKKDYLLRDLFYGGQ